jgi:hypothetical protein
MYLSPSRRGLGRARRLGLVSTAVNGSLVYGSSPITRVWGGNPPRATNPVAITGPISAPVRPIGPATPVSTTPPYSQMPANGPYYPGSGSYYPPSSGQYGSSSSNGSSGWQGGWRGSQSGQSSSSQTNAQALATAQALLATNPSLLTQAQFTMLQQAGLVSATLPYSSVSQITATTPASTTASTTNDANCVAAGCTGGPYPNCTCAAASTSTDIGTMLGTTYAGLPLYLWLIIGGGAAYLFSRSGGRR